MVNIGTRWDAHVLPANAGTPYSREWTMASQPQENSPAVEPPGQQNGQPNFAHRNHQVTKAVGNGRVEEAFHVAAEKACGNLAKANHIFAQIKGDRIHPDPNERPAPVLPLE